MCTPEGRRPSRRRSWGISFSKRIAWAASLAIAAAACGTARITKLDSHRAVDAYGAKVADDVVAVGIQVEERPGDEHFWLNSAFRDRDLLVLSAKFRNTGGARLLVNRCDLALTTIAGKRLVPLSPVEAVDRAKGMLGVYRPLSLGTIHYGYDRYAIPELFILAPGQEVAGYLYFHVKKKDWEDARRGRLRVPILRFEVAGESEYGVHLPR